MRKTTQKEIRSAFPRRVDDKNRLLEQKSVLEQKDLVIKEILRQIERGSEDIRKNIIANVENLLLPIVQNLELTGVSYFYIQLLRDNLKELTSKFGAKLSDKEIKLTPREIEICNMIKNGTTNKEISILLNISSRTTEKHRANIRKKLDISKEYNLLTFLKAL